MGKTAGNGAIHHVAESHAFGRILDLGRRVTYGKYVRSRLPTAALRVLVREADALRRQSMLLHRSLAPRGVALPARGEPVDVVFLLHGVAATAGVFGPLEQRLRAAGIDHVASFTYHPFRSIESLARELRRAVRWIPPRGRVHLVGHSLGGIVARWYVQEAGGASRVAQTISLASPFHGTRVARYVPGSFARHLEPDSSLLARLRHPSRIAIEVPHTSFVAAGDVIVSPPESAAFPFGDVVTVEGVGHNALLFDGDVASEISARIVSGRQDARAA